MRKHKFWRILTRVHKWAGLVLGIQIILWFASGLFMSFFPIDDVHGDHLAEEKNWPLTAEYSVMPQDALQLYPKGSKDIYSINFRSALGMPIWEINGSQGRIFVDAKSGALWEGLTETQIRTGAKFYYKGQRPIKTAILFDVAPKDYRDDVPIWQVAFDDSAKTRLYISPDTGDLVKVRTRLWRAFDFMWMLHIMGYPDRDNMNTWWLILAALAALMFALSGAGLVVHRVFMRPKAKRKR